MHDDHAPDAIDTGMVFRIYSWVAIAGGLWVLSWGGAGYRWPLPPFDAVDLPAISYGRASLVLLASAVVVGAGLCAAGFSRIQDPADRGRALYLFACAHLTVGALLLFQWLVVWRDHVPLVIMSAPLVTGALLVNLAFTAHGLPRLGDGLLDMFRDPRRRASRARSRYEEQIRQAVRHEERVRLARELHDAVKQQLFVVQTAAATAEMRFETDPAEARAAMSAVRSAGRVAMSEMDALLHQLQASPTDNAGLVEALKKEVEALGFRTGADVQFEVGDLPPTEALQPGTQQAIFRTAQEALSNVARHARAHHVEVTLEATGDRLRLAVTDDGGGFRFDARAPGIGLRNMRSRAEEHGGTLDVTSTPGRGTTVALSLPYTSITPGRFGWPAIAWGTLAGVHLTLVAAGGRWQPFWIFMSAGCLFTAVRYASAWAAVRRSTHRRGGLRSHAGAAR